jgi:hypothetical protein
MVEVGRKFVKSDRHGNRDEYAKKNRWRFISPEIVVGY